MTKQERRKHKQRIKLASSSKRLPPIPPSKRFKSKKDYKRNNKVRPQDVED